MAEQYNTRESVYYAKLYGNVKFWEGALTEARGEKTKTSARNLRYALKYYKTQVPREWRERMEINVKSLEAQCARVLDAEIKIEIDREGFRNNP